MKNALVWGASGTIGQAVLNKLKAEGWTTVGIVRDSFSTPQFADFVFETKFEDPEDIKETVYLVSQEISDMVFYPPFLTYIKRHCAHIFYWSDE